MSRSHTPSLNKTHIANIGRHNNKVEDKHTKALKKLESFKTEYPEYYITSTGLAEQFIKDHKIPEGEGAQASLPNITLDFTFKSILTNLLFLTVFLNSIKVNEASPSTRTKEIADCAEELYKDPKYRDVFDYYKTYYPDEYLIEERSCDGDRACITSNMMYLAGSNKIVYSNEGATKAVKEFRCSTLKHELEHYKMANALGAKTPDERWQHALEGDKKINKECKSIFNAYYRTLSNLLYSANTDEGFEKLQTLVKHAKQHNPEIKQYSDREVRNMIVNERDRMDFYLKTFGEDSICGETLANIKHAPFANSIGKLQELFGPKERVESIKGKGMVDIATAVEEHSNYYHQKIKARLNQDTRGDL